MKSIARATGLSIKQVELIAANTLFENEAINNMFQEDNPQVKEIKSMIKQFRQKAKALDYLC